MIATTRPTRVLVIIDGLGTGGAETSLADLARGMEVNHIEAHIAYFHRRSGAREKLEDQGMPLYEIGNGSRIRRLFSLIQLIRRLQPDLVHTMVYEADILGRLAAASQGIPVMSSLINTSYSRAWFNTGANKVKLAVAYLLDVLTCNFVTTFHSISHSTSDIMCKRLHIDHSKVTTVYRGRDEEEFRPLTVDEKNSIRASLGVPPGTLLILTTSRHEPQKRLPLLIESLSLVLQDRPKTHLIIAGREGTDTPKLKVMIESMGIASRIQLLGHRGDVARLLSAADLFVCASAWEGFAGSVVEALAVGTPIVAADIDVLREVTTPAKGKSFATFFKADDVADLARAILDAGATPRPDEQSPPSRTFFLTRYSSAIVSGQMAELYRSVAANRGQDRKTGRGNNAE